MKVDRATADAKLRLSGYLVVNQFLSAQHALRRAFGLDPEDLLIVLTVALGSVQRMMRDPDPEGLAISTSPVEQQRIVPVSRRAIARSLELPRETVRRRTASLVERGVLLEWDEGLRTARRLVLKPEIRDAIHELLETTAGTSRALLREGVFEDLCNAQ